MTIPLKQWCAEEAQREKISPRTILSRLSRGKYSWVSLKRVNKRVIFVEVDKQFDWMGCGAITEGTK